MQKKKNEKTRCKVEERIKKRCNGISETVG